MNHRHMSRTAFRTLLQSLFSVCLAGASALAGAQSLDQEDAYFRGGPEAGRHALIITGAAASDEIRERFSQWSNSLHDVLARDFGYGSDTITLLLDDGSTADQNERVDGSSRRQDITAAFAGLQQTLSPGDQLMVFLIGHGSSTDAAAKFNIVGPDITGQEFAELLAPLNQQDIVIINTTSGSFEFSGALAGPGRVILSATRTRAERYDPMFARYLIDALDGRQGDRDKNGRVSVLEAWTFASQSVLGWYSEQGRLPTERAVIDDNGDGNFSLEAAAGSGDGGLAEIAYFDNHSAGPQKTSPEARTLQAEMQDLERAVFLLRGQKANYLDEDYWTRMETLLIDLARKTGRYNELP